MSRVIPLSRKFPSYHPRKGEPTYFVEKFHWWLYECEWSEHPSLSDMLFEINPHLPEKLIEDFIASLDTDGNYEGVEKHHTIREGHRFKEGDWCSIRTWSGKPYASKQIILAPDIRIPKTMNFRIYSSGPIYLNGKGYEGETEGDFELLDRLALNDGLSRHDFLSWFKYPRPFDGQVIFWNDKINY